MPPCTIERTARAVLAQYAPQLYDAQLTPLANSGGFSGAWLWRADLASQSYCLRAWPVDGPTTDKLTQIHALMHGARKRGLEFVPEVAVTTHGQTIVSGGGRCWEVTQWMPGFASFHQEPSNQKLESACIAVARIHQVWSEGQPPVGVVPGVLRRLTRVEEWNALQAAGWQPRDLNELEQRAWRAVTQHIDRVPLILAPWRHRQYALHHCLADIWHDHVLYTDERVTGMIDYGGVRIDHPAVDLARLLGSLIGDDVQSWQTGVDAYRRVVPWPDEHTELARALDKTGVILGLANWLRWLHHEHRGFYDLGRVYQRIGALVGRAEQFIF